MHLTDHSTPACKRRLAIIGGGPSGLRAAEVAASEGMDVALFERMPSVGRKFLVAGKGGLNLTHSELLETFATRYSGEDQAPDFWPRALENFSPQMMRAWADSLGVETFRASNGRIYPTALKAAPLLRRWVSRLKENGVQFHLNHRCCGLEQDEHGFLIHFENGTTHACDVVIMAMGGASWPRTGSDGSWMTFLTALGIPCSPLLASNCGWGHAWPEAIVAEIEGKPLKNLLVTADGKSVHGELLITRYGLEGGAIYQLGSALRKMAKPEITIDFKPTYSEAELIRKMESARGDLLDAAIERWRLSPAAAAILRRDSWPNAAALASGVKHAIFRLTQPQPIAEAISSAGGVAWKGLDESLMARETPGLFFAGEMLDWDAPTGGYLLQGCFATGTLAAQAAAQFGVAPAKESR
ncbi:MAG: TIGR03862 family flavoprotein [Verrucomicrobia bacterium]|nr:MAG: TIGR03862 family flavoprotein [Verrucomicrobiota bacterium]